MVMNYGRKYRIVSALLAFVFIINMFDTGILWESLASLRANAAESDYTVSFSWDVSTLTTANSGETQTEELTDNGKKITVTDDSTDEPIRDITISDDKTVLSLNENRQESPVVKTVFTFNMKKKVDAGELQFTIQGMSDLKRGGGFKLDMSDPNLSKWDIAYDSEKDLYTFTNKDSIKPNSVTKFVWQFDSRAAVNGFEKTLETTCTVKEYQKDEEGNKIKEGDLAYAEHPAATVQLKTDSLVMNYTSEHDDNEVKIVCDDISKLDPNNLNVDYTWRSYTSKLGLKGFTEYEDEACTMQTNSLTDAHYIRSDSDAQRKSLNARGIKTSDYFIEVDAGGLGIENLLVVDESGSRVQLIEVDGKIGFYNFRGAKDFKVGENYTSTYRVGVLTKAVEKAAPSANKQITLTGHYYVTYNDETTPKEYTDKAAHLLTTDEKPQGGGTGPFIKKHNTYEINHSHTEATDGLYYYDHAKHPSPIYQLLYDSIFNGKTVTYSLDGKINKAVDADKNAVSYDLVYEDTAPSVQQLLQTYTDADGVTHDLGYTERVLRAAEYDFTRVKVRKLVDGDTVGYELNEDGTIKTDENGNPIPKAESGFDYDVFGRSDDGEWQPIKNNENDAHTGNTVRDSEVFLPENIDEIRIVVRDLKIDAPVCAWVDIKYNLDRDELYNHVQIDTVTDHGGDRRVSADENEGTRLKNTFSRKQYVNTYDETAVPQKTDSAFSYTWLRESTTTVESKTAMTDFDHIIISQDDEAQTEAKDYFETEITSIGKIYSDNERSLNHFVVVSQVPKDLSLSEGWLDQLVDSFTFSGTIQGSGQVIDQEFVKNNDAVSFYYDPDKRIVVAEFNFEGYSLDGSKDTDIQFTYPANITYDRLKATGGEQNKYVAETYVTVLDQNVRLSRAAGSNIDLSPTNPFNDLPAAKSEASASINARGSYEEDETTKKVKSHYTDWIYENTAEVDGSNTDHLQNGRMTSEYTYELHFKRIATGVDTLSNPIMLDIVEGVNTSAWKGTVQSISFEDGYYPALADGQGYTPEVYFITEDKVSGAPNADYKKTINYVSDAIAYYQHYDKQDTHSQEELAKTLEHYNNIKQHITGVDADGNSVSTDWVKAQENADGSWSINTNGKIIYAVAVLFRGTYTIDNRSLDLRTDLNMKAPALEDEVDANIINNRAAYNDLHCFGEKSNTTERYGVYNVSNKTLVLLRHIVELVKVSSKTQRRLTGAAFSVFNDDAGTSIVKYWPDQKATEPRLMKDMPVDKSGTLQMNLSPGVYYYKETKAPDGFIADDKLYRFRVVSDSNNVYYYTVDFKTADEVAEEYLVINKYEYDRYKTTVYSGKSFIGPDQDFFVFDSNGNKLGFTYSDELKSFIYDAGETNAAVNTRAGEEGVIKLTGLPAGTYFFGKNYTSDDNKDKDGYYFSVADNGYIDLVVMKKTVFKTPSEVQPANSDVQYELYEMLGDEVTASDKRVYFTRISDGSYNLKTNTTEADETDDNARIVPNSSGQVILNGLDNNKKYYFVIKKAPVGFKLRSSTDMTFKPDENGKLDLISAEQLQYTGRIVVEDDPIETAKANFVKVDGTMINGAPKGTNGVRLNGAEYNMYVLEEDGSESLVYFLYDHQAKVYIYRGIEGKTGWTADLNSSDGNESGTISVEGMPYGMYFVKETKAPASFDLSDQRYYFRVSAMTIGDDGSLKFESQDDEKLLMLSDDEILSSIVFSKYDFRNNTKYLKDARYGLYVLKANTDPDLTEEDYRFAAESAVESARGDTETDQFTQYWDMVEAKFTDQTGEIEFNNLAFGTYLLYELREPLGYTWNNDKSKWSTWTTMDTTKHEAQIIEINADTVAANSETKNVSGTDANGNTVITEQTTYYPFRASHCDDRQMGEARLLKSSSGEESKPLTDGTFSLYKVNFTPEEENTYLRDKMKLTDAQINALTADQRKIYLENIGVDDLVEEKHVVNGKALKDVDTLVKSGLRTDADPSQGGTESVSGLDWGVYYFLEAKAPAGYQKDPTPKKFKVDATTATARIDVSMEDDKTYGKLWMYKQAKTAEEGGYHKKLFGAQFDLYTKDGVKVNSVAKLRLGGLTIDGQTGKTKEFIVKSFTVVDAETIRFTILDDNGTTEYTVTEKYYKDMVTDGSGKLLQGTIKSVEADSAFMQMYTDLSVDSFRLTYYIVDGDNIFDYGMEKYRPMTNVEKTHITGDSAYVTADEGGQMCVRGLDWGSYYFRETVPPEGYSLCDDVLFTVNAYNCNNQFIKCEDPDKQAAIIIDKHIPDTDYFKAYGEPTFMFKVSQLTDAAEGETPDFVQSYQSGSSEPVTRRYKKTGKSYTLAVHMTSTDGTAMIDVPEGQYMIEELPVSRYTCTGLELVTGTGNVVNKTAGLNSLTSTVMMAADKYELTDGTAAPKFTAFCDLTGGVSDEVLTFRVKYTNVIKRYDNFSEVTFVDNRIPGEEYITAFKPTYKPLVPVTTGQTTFEINLKDAIGSGDFEAVLSYNTEKIKSLTADELSYIRFSNVLPAPFEFVSYNPDTGVLTLTIRNDGTSIAGQSFKFDVGYKAGLTEYNESDHDMNKGELELVFGEPTPQIRKRVLYKSDAANRSRFIVGEDKTTVVDATYTKEGTSISSDPSPIPELRIDDGYVQKGWYMLSSTGRPVKDSEGNIVMFMDEAEVKAYIYGDSAPSGVSFADEFADFAHPDKIMGFTFQAEVIDRPVTARFVMRNGTGLLTIINDKDRTGNDKITSLGKDTMIAFREGNEAGWESCNNNSRVTYDSRMNNARDKNLDNTYPDKIRFYAIDNVVYWYTVDRDTLKPTRGSVYLEYRISSYNQDPKLFDSYNKLADVSGMFDWDFSGVELCSYMFSGTAITNFELNRTYKKSGLMYLNRMFINCQNLTTVTMNVDTSEAGDGTVDISTNGTFISAQTKEMFKKCTNLVSLNITGDFRKLFSAQRMFDSCNLPADEFKRAFSTWQWGPEHIKMQDNDSNKGDQIFSNYPKTNDIKNVDLVDANNDHYTSDGIRITKTS